MDYNAFNFPGNNPWYDQKRKPNPEVTLKRKAKGFWYLPEGRLTATELLQDASFKAVMEIYYR